MLEFRGGMLCALLTALVACGGSNAGDPSVCSEPMNASSCPSGSSPQPRMQSYCESSVEDTHCGKQYEAIVECENQSPNCVTPNGTSVANLQACDAQQTAWDDCVDPNHKEQ